MQQTFKPGQIVGDSGVYTVTHDKDDAGEHDVTFVKGKRLPTSSICGEHPGSN